MQDEGPGLLCPPPPHLCAANTSQDFGPPARTVQCSWRHDCINTAHSNTPFPFGVTASAPCRIFGILSSGCTARLFSPAACELRWSHVTRSGPQAPEHLPAGGKFSRAPFAPDIANCGCQLLLLLLFFLNARSKLLSYLTRY